MAVFVICKVTDHVDRYLRTFLIFVPVNFRVKHINGRVYQVPVEVVTEHHVRVHLSFGQRHVAFLLVWDYRWLELLLCDVVPFDFLEKGM